MPDSDSSSSSDTNDVETGENEMDITSTANDISSPDKQEARAFLRERFLRLVTGLIGKPANFQLYENTRVEGEYRGCDIDFTDLYVRNLKTPLGTVPEAILRAGDVIFMEIKEV